MEKLTNCFCYLPVKIRFNKNKKAKELKKGTLKKGKKVKSLIILTKMIMMMMMRRMMMMMKIVAEIEYEKRNE